MRRPLARKLLMTALCSTIAVTVASSALAATTKLTFWTWYGDPSFKAPMESLLKDFMKENPSIKVVHSIFDFGSIQDKYLATVIAGTQPDVVLASSRGLVQMAYAGAFSPLDPLIARDRFDVKDVYSSLWPGVSYAGRKYALPFAGGNQQAMWYNKDMFAEVGLDPKSGPKTWSDFADACRKLSRDRNSDGKLDFWGVDSSLMFESTLLANGGDWTSPDGSKVLWNSEKGIEAMEYINSMYNKYRVVNAGWGTPFETGKSAMHLEGPYALSRYLKVAKFKFGLGMHPQNDGVTNFRMWASTDSLALSKKPKEKMEAGWRLIRFMMQPDVQAKWSVMTGFPPNVRSASATSTFRKAAAEQPLLQTGADLVEYATSFYPCIKDKDLEPMVARYQNLVIAGKMSSKMAVDKATDEANKLISRFLKVQKK